METEGKPKRERRSHSAREKCQAVLALWTGSRRPSEICRELSIPLNLLSSWQERAMEGMLQVLEPTRRQRESGPMLSARMEQMLERKVARLSSRITRLSPKARGNVQQAAEGA